MSNIKNGEMPKQKEICQWCGKEFITFERIPGGSIRGRYYCCIDHTCKALAKEKEEEGKEVKKERKRVPARRKRECPVCGEKFRSQSEESLYCDRCKYIGWAKRTALMEQRKSMR